MAYGDGLVECPNGNALRRDIERFSGESIGMLAVDFALLKPSNDAFGDNVGDDALRIGYDLLRKSVSQCKEKVGIYREKGDTFIIFAKDLEEEIFKTIPAEINRLCSLINNGNIDVLDNLYKLPSGLRKIMHFHIGYEYSQNYRDHKKNLKEILDKSKNTVVDAKRDYYMEHPELDPRKSNIIEELREGLIRIN